VTHTYIAVDFGAGSGRVMAGSCYKGTIKLEEIHRFSNRQVRVGKHVYWDFPALFQDMKDGLRKAVAKGYSIKSIGIDTWGVDFGFIDKKGNLLGNPICYRDSYTDGMTDEVFSRIDISKHYTESGTQVMGINTLFQLCSMKKEEYSPLAMADKLLFMPDLFSYFLTGTANNEYCIASTSELLDARKRDWNRELIRTLGLPEHLFGEIVMPGTSRGFVKPEILEEIGATEPIEVVAVASHDTASAVFATPLLAKERGRQAFLSSGTWSLLGVEADQPILTEQARLAQFTNEGGVGGKIRFLQNITGLWILQRLMAEWKEQGANVEYDYLLPEAEKSAIDSYINVDDEAFQNPVSMVKAIAESCRKQGVSVPVSQGDYVRCALQSLARRYKEGIELLNTLLPQPVEQIVVIGGGGRNKLLNRLTAEATGIPVGTGPVEATALGNVLVQAIAQGEVASRDEMTFCN